MAKRMPIQALVNGLAAALNRVDGYIMGATGQDPKSWPKTSGMFTQYSGSKLQQALYWREHAARVWDCNGLAEGLYKEYAGVSINTYARMNYAGWCGTKGKGTIPAQWRVPGAAVFWGETAAAIHHVAYLYKPVRDGHPEGDWYLIEARGVMYGVVMTLLSQRKPNYWGIMDKYFDYAEVTGSVPAAQHLGGRLLRNGTEGEDVRELQAMLIELGCDCGRWGADGEFGDATEMAVREFQRAHGLEVDGVVGPRTIGALDAAMAALKSAATASECVEIVGGSCYVRKGPGTSAEILGVVRDGTVLPYDGLASDDGWLLVEYQGANGWVSGKYGRLKRTEVEQK